MTTKAKPPEERFWAKVDATGDCWEWTGARYSNGYGEFMVTAGASALAHRFAWERLVGPIPKGLELHHNCRNRVCLNPDHLEVVTRREHCRRGYLNLSGLLTKTQQQRAQTHCLHGHEYTPGNTHRRRTTGRRRCRACDRVSKRTQRLEAQLRRAA